jgi:hypothetical protein
MAETGANIGFIVSQYGLQEGVENTHKYKYPGIHVPRLSSALSSYLARTIFHAYARQCC